MPNQRLGKIGPSWSVVRGGGGGGGGVIVGWSDIQLTISNLNKL